MKLKTRNRTPHGGFVFFFKLSSGETIQVSSPNFNSLVSDSKKIMTANSIAVPQNLEEIIDHQICSRAQDPLEDCWSGGLGDDLHNKWIGPFLRRAAAKIAPRNSGSIMAVARQAVSEAIKKVANCRTCGGGKVYKEGETGMGRAGKINKVFKK